jgi:LCP family protein required for cell wall assembly
MTSNSNNSNTQEENVIMAKPRRFDKTRVLVSRIKRKILSHVWLARISLVLLFIFVLFILGVFVKSLFFESSLSYYYGLAKDFVFAPKENLNIVDGRVNLLVLGKGGGNHEAPDLTDTMIFISISPENKSITMVSLPRDIWIPELRAKLNSTYYWGNNKKQGGGLVLTKSVVEKIVGQTIQYGIVIDFEGFKKIIDILGGIEVDVKNSFTDEKYPIPGKENDSCAGDPEYKCRYETLHFIKGKQFMDGEKALKFVRSRNAEGDEGTDFARAARQQKVISAIKDKILTREVLLSPKKLSELKSVILEHVEEDIEPNSAAVLARFLFDARNNVKSYVLPEEYLLNPPKSSQYDYLYVLTPRNENPSTDSGQDWDKVHKWVNGILK